jgi:hypothetical protein
MADKVITGLNKIVDVNYGDSLVIAQNEAEAKRVEVADFLTDTNSSYAIQSGIHCFDHGVKVSGNFSVTGNTSLGSGCNTKLTVNSDALFMCDLTVGEGISSNGNTIIFNNDVSGKNFTGDFANFKSGLFSGLTVTGDTTLGDGCDDTVRINAAAIFECGLTVGGGPEAGDETIIFNNDVSGKNFTGDFANFKSGLFSGLTVTGDTTLGDECDDHLTVNARTTFNCDVSGKNFTGDFAYFNSGHFPSGIEVDAPTSEGACDMSTQSRQNAAIWPSSDRAYNIGAYSQAFDHGYAVQWNDLSDKNTKKEIRDTNLGLNFITGLKPRSFKFKDHLSSRGDLIQHNRTRHGLVAQEVKDTLDSIGVSTSGFAGYIDSSHQYPDQETSYWLHYSQFISPLIKSVQELHAMVTGLQDQIDNA